MTYEVLFGKDWITTTKAVVTRGWLHYEQLRDGTIGLARPGTWRSKPVKARL